MTLKKLQTCATDTLTYFLQTMPDVPFMEDDVVIEFAKRKDMVDRAKALCKIYVPDKKFNESQAKQLNTTVAANALTGRGKSVVLFCTDYKAPKHRFGIKPPVLFFHEFMHIYCAKSEINGEHFIDIYGSGHTYGDDPKEKIYDGQLNAGYVVWSEFIAHYYALLKVSDDIYDFSEVRPYAYDLLCDVSLATDELSKGSFSYACAYILNCTDIEEVLNSLTDLSDDEPEEISYEEKNTKALLDCLRYLHNKLQTDKPWKITEDFILTLGSKFLMFKFTNSICLGHINAN